MHAGCCRCLRVCRGCKPNCRSSATCRMSFGLSTALMSLAKPLCPPPPTRLILGLACPGPNKPSWNSLMSASSKHLKRSLGVPFWIGCLVGPIIFLIFLAVLGIFHDSYTFWFFVCVALVVFGPVGGAIFQVVHDVIAVSRLRLFRVWDYSVFVAIAVASVVAGFALFHASGKNLEINPFKNRTFDAAGAFMVMVVLVYAAWQKIGHFFSPHLFHTEAVSLTLPHNIRAFVAGGFTFMFFQGLVLGLFESLASIVAGKPAWLMLAGSVVFGGVGVALGLALLKGSPGALRVVRLLLLLTVAGGSIGFVMSILQVLPHQSWSEIADVLVSLALLIVISKYDCVSP